MPLLLLIGVSACSKKIPEAGPDLHTSGKAQLPDGKGGIYKTGNPYRIDGRWYKPMQHKKTYDERGMASWYGKDFHGKKTANGEVYDMHALSAAHKTIPLPTLMRVTNLDNGRSVIVRVNDRGPFVKDRLIDLSYAAAKELDFMQQGTTRVRVQSLEMSSAAKKNPPATQNNTTAQSKPATAPSPELPVPPTTASSGYIFVQLGAFGSKDNATRLQQKLLLYFPAAHTVAINMAEKILYKVRIGPFEDMMNIEKTVITLEQQGFQTPMVIIE